MSAYAQDEYMSSLGQLSCYAEPCRSASVGRARVWSAVDASLALNCNVKRLDKTDWEKEKNFYSCTSNPDETVNINHQLGFFISKTNVFNEDGSINLASRGGDPSDHAYVYFQQIIKEIARTAPATHPIKNYATRTYNHAGTTLANYVLFKNVNSHSVQELLGGKFASYRVSGSFIIPDGLVAQLTSTVLEEVERLDGLYCLYTQDVSCFPDLGKQNKEQWIRLMFRLYSYEFLERNGPF